jgi:hypothetical protein
MKLSSGDWLYALALAGLIGFMIFVGINVYKYNQSEDCQATATSQAAELYRQAYMEPDEELARHYATLADATVASRDLTC